MKKIMLFGSSIFEQWYNCKDILEGYEIVNRAIGGTKTQDWLEDNLLPVLKEENPDIILMYCGSNDMWDINEDITKNNVIQIRDVINKFNKNIKFSYFSIIKSLSKSDIWDKVQRVNDFIKENLYNDDYFYDFNSIFFNNGEIIKEYFIEDGTHHPNILYDKLVVDAKPKLEKWLKN